MLLFGNWLNFSHQLLPSLEGDYRQRILDVYNNKNTPNRDLILFFTAIQDHVFNEYNFYIVDNYLTKGLLALINDLKNRWIRKIYTKLRKKLCIYTLNSNQIKFFPVGKHYQS